MDLQHPPSAYRASINHFTEDQDMPAYVYVLRSAITGQHYIGATRDLQAKIARHNNTTAMLSRPGGPLECVYVEVCESLDAARTRERYLKSLDGVDEKIRILYTATARNPRK